MTAWSDFGYLWATRKSSGFPWPFQTRSCERRRDKAWLLATGMAPWAAVPRWKQLLSVPLRPWRYARMVRGIARTRAVFYSHSMNDDVA